ncbi:hypothetical protein CSHISOI_06989 [Colletotrichum shisoi]|uniref:Uncharacterized protein n=1 Tax=Colletotrichum shisoi TaxID=2078593 RepID=A0A5Q4BN69_9PEZI|nr:hypothetical protein CSHISOI_06989 [Colletotrichum shisoi]
MPITVVICNIRGACGQLWSTGQSILHYIHYPHKVYRPRGEGKAPCARSRRTTNLNPSRKGR